MAQANDEGIGRGVQIARPAAAVRALFEVSGHVCAKSGRQLADEVSTQVEFTDTALLGHGTSPPVGICLAPAVSPNILIAPSMTESATARDLAMTTDPN